MWAQNLQFYGFSELVKSSKVSKCWKKIEKFLEKKVNYTIEIFSEANFPGVQMTCCATKVLKYFFAETQKLIIHKYAWIE